MSFRVIGIGEVLWDLLPGGPQLGGAPGNFAYHARLLGANARVISRVGNDRPGREILQRFAEMGITKDLVQVDQEAPTGAATVLLKSLGVPIFVIHENVAWDRLALTDAALKAVRQADAVCFGSLAQRTPSAARVIQQLVAQGPPGCLRIFDVNLRQEYYDARVIEQSLVLANTLKLNDQELPVLAEMFGFDGPVRRQVEHLARRFELEVVALTRGDKGSLLYRAGQWSDLPGSSVRVVDTVGAGDSFTAALVMGLLCRMSLGEVHQAAAAIADYVCTCPGATPAVPARLREMFKARGSGGAVASAATAAE